MKLSMSSSTESLKTSKRASVKANPIEVKTRSQSTLGLETSAFSNLQSPIFISSKKESMMAVLPIPLYFNQII